MMAFAALSGWRSGEVMVGGGGVGDWVVRKGNNESHVLSLPHILCKTSLLLITI